VDNIRCAHSRDPYTGDREIVVAMLDGMRRPQQEDDPGVGR
jgi:hypothetical protein